MFDILDFIIDTVEFIADIHNSKRDRNNTDNKSKFETQWTRADLHLEKDNDLSTKNNK